MPKTFLEMHEQLRQETPMIVAVAAAHDEEVIASIQESYQRNLAKAILVGDEPRIRTLLNEMNCEFEPTIIHEPDEKEAARKAVSLIREGQAHVLMKGLINSADFLKAVLSDKQEHGDRRVLSHLAALEVPGFPKIVFLTDGGMNIAPDWEMKQQILINALEALHKMGIAKPNVAILTANEVVNPKMQATVDAAKLVEQYEAGGLPDCRMEGPITMDVALSPEAAKHKGIKSAISGKVDVLLMPNIEGGNLVAKAWIYGSGGKMAGIIAGASYPIVLTSRADTAEGKLNSLVLACLVGGKGNK